MSTRCAVCGKARRRGSSRKLAIIEGGTVRSGFACGECASRAVLVAVPPAKAPPAPDEVRPVLLALAKMYRGQAKLSRVRGEDLDAEIWQTAAELAEGRANFPATRNLGA